MSPGLDTPLELPCGIELSNRLCKAAMTEGLGNPHNQATERTKVSVISAGFATVSDKTSAFSVTNTMARVPA